MQIDLSSLLDEMRIKSTSSLDISSPDYHCDSDQRDVSTYYLHAERQTKSETKDVSILNNQDAELKYHAAKRSKWDIANAPVSLAPTTSSDFDSNSNTIRRVACPENRIIHGPVTCRSPRTSQKPPQIPNLKLGLLGKNHANAPNNENEINKNINHTCRSTATWNSIDIPSAKKTSRKGSTSSYLLKNHGSVTARAKTSMTPRSEQLLTPRSKANIVCGINKQYSYDYHNANMNKNQRQNDANKRKSALPSSNEHLYKLNDSPELNRRKKNQEWILQMLDPKRKKTDGYSSSENCERRICDIFGIDSNMGSMSASIKTMKQENNKKLLEIQLSNIHLSFIEEHMRSFCSVVQKSDILDWYECNQEFLEFHTSLIQHRKKMEEGVTFLCEDDKTDFANDKLKMKIPQSHFSSLQRNVCVLTKEGVAVRRRIAPVFTTRVDADYDIHDNKKKLKSTAGNDKKSFMEQKLPGKSSHDLTGSHSVEDLYCTILSSTVDWYYNFLQTRLCNNPIHSSHVYGSNGDVQDQYRHQLKLIIQWIMYYEQQQFCNEGKKLKELKHTIDGILDTKDKS